MQQYQKKQLHAPSQSRASQGRTATTATPNSIVLSSMGRTSSGRPDLDQKMRERMQTALNNQRPMAEAEADRLASDVNPGASTEEVKSAMGRKLGADFSQVRIHTDASARAKADSMGAEAYTSGKDIYFGSEGQNAQTVAHELVHTVQQGEVMGMGVTQSAPSGTVQMKPGGLFKKFKGLFHRKKKDANAVAAGKYDRDFEGLTNADKYAKLQDMRKYLDNRQTQIKLTNGKDQLSDYDKDIEASYESVMQKSSRDEEFMNMVRNNPLTAANAYMDKQRSERDAFDSRPDRGDPTSDEEMYASKGNMIRNVGFSNEAHDLKSSYGMMQDMRRLASSGRTRDQFLKNTTMTANLAGSAQGDYARTISYALGELRNDSDTANAYAGDAHQFAKDHSQALVDDFQGRYAARPGRRHRFRRHP